MTVDGALSEHVNLRYKELSYPRFAQKSALAKRKM